VYNQKDEAQMVYIVKQGEFEAIRFKKVYQK
jgi:hypothetical protein